MLRKPKFTRSVVGIALCLFILATGVAYAQVNGYDLSWWTVDAGGGESAGGSYRLNGTIGQVDAGDMSGGNYSLAGGFWGNTTAAAKRIFLPLLVR